MDNVTTMENMTMGPKKIINSFFKIIFINNVKQLKEYPPVIVVNNITYVLCEKLRCLEINNY